MQQSGSQPESDAQIIPRSARAGRGRRTSLGSIPAALGATVVLAACGSSGGSPAAGSSGAASGGTTHTDAGPTTHASARPVELDKSVVQSAPGGGRVKVTLVSYEQDVSEASNDALAPKVFGITLRLQNLGGSAVKAKSPTWYSVLHLADTAGATTVQGASGPCAGDFYRSPIRLAPHGSSEGCIPYAYGSSLPVSFGFGFGANTASWPVRAR